MASRVTPLLPELLPKPVESSFVDHVVEPFPVGVEFQASLADFALIDLDVAAEDQEADSICHPLEFVHSLAAGVHAFSALSTFALISANCFL